jgi:hypothetical protein
VQGKSRYTLSRGPPKSAAPGGIWTVLDCSERRALLWPVGDSLISQPGCRPPPGDLLSEVSPDRCKGNPRRKTTRTGHARDLHHSLSYPLRPHCISITQKSGSFCTSHCFSVYATVGLPAPHLIFSRCISVIWHTRVSCSGPAASSATRPGNIPR